jgi:hypothetical protein
MSQTTTLILLPQTVYNGGGNANVYTVTGDRYPAAAYYLGNQDLQTVALSTLSVTGNIVIEASLATDPSGTDWFDVYKLEANANAPSNTASKIASTTSLGINIEGNYVWMRAKLEDFAEGTLQYVKLTY